MKLSVMRYNALLCFITDERLCWSKLQSRNVLTSSWNGCSERDNASAVGAIHFM